MLEKSVTQWISDLASKEPVPGGGGASALVGAIGMALGSMVGNLTVGKKKYADVEEELQEVLGKSANIIGKLAHGIADDMLSTTLLPLASVPVQRNTYRLWRRSSVTSMVISEVSAPCAIEAGTGS